MVRIGIVGLGNMGTSHGRRIESGEVPNAELVAVCDRNEDRFSLFPDAAHFTDHKEMLESGLIDAVIIATHHYVHTPVSIDAVQSGIHFLVEKPLGVHKSDCLRTIRAFEDRKDDSLVFGLMLNQRTRPVYRKLKSLIDNGELGRIRRVSWTITDWFRPEIYYRSGGWRATWKGEGGGVLLNQCPHQLDLFQWLFGMPGKVRAFGSPGKYHDIEVEDEITAYLEYSDGLTAVFTASTGEAPGINRLEIAAERGLLVVEGNLIRWQRNETETSVFSAAAEDLFAKPECWELEIPAAAGEAGEHNEVLTGFVNAIEGTGNMVAHGSEGIHSVELGNAMLFSALNDVTVSLPLDGRAYEKMLGDLITNSRFEKKISGKQSTAVVDMSSSF